MSTTKPVVVDNVTVSVVSERQLARAASRDCNYRELAKRGTKHTDGRQSPGVVGQGDFHDAGTRAESRQGLCWSQQLDEPAANRRVAGRGRGHDDAVRIGQ